MYRCSSCDYETEDRRNLRRHLAKFVPCDFSCHYCSEEFEYRKAWNRHMKSCHPVEWEQRQPLTWTDFDEEKLDEMRVDSQALVPVDPDLRRIPIEDFGWRVVVTTTDEICYTNGVYQVHRKQVIEKITHRNENIRAAFDLPSMAYAVKILVPSVDLDQIAMQIIMMHCDGRKPEFNSFYLGDLSRLSVKHYSRPDVESEHCRWVTQPKEAAVRTINKHMRNLLPMLLEEGCAKLEPRMWKRGATEDGLDIPILVLHDTEAMRHPGFYMDYSESLLCRNMYPEELGDCPESKPMLDHIAKLKEIVDKEKDRVLKVIKMHEMDPESVNLFLSETRKLDIM